MDIFAKIRLSDSNYCGLFKLVKLELGGISMDAYVWKMHRNKTDKLKKDPPNAFHLKKTEAQQFHIDYVMYFSFVESDIQ